MKFMGSKARINKFILPIMLAERTPYQWWVEPFVGGGNSISEVRGPRLGGDIDPHVIAALTAIRDSLDKLPKNNEEFTEKDYHNLRLCDHPFKGYLGFTASYAGKWMGGWCRDRSGKRDYVAEAYRNALKQSPKLQGVNLVVADYRGLDIPPCSLIYCDIQYRSTTGYRVGYFDYDAFYHWCAVKAEEGHTVFLSEYSAPEEFECVWSKEISTSLTQDTGSKKGVEKLFKYKGK